MSLARLINSLVTPISPLAGVEATGPIAASPPRRRKTASPIGLVSAAVSTGTEVRCRVGERCGVMPGEGALPSESSLTNRRFARESVDHIQYIRVSTPCVMADLALPKASECHGLGTA